MVKTIEFVSDNMLFNNTINQEQANNALEQLRNERHMLLDAESARVRARYDLLDAVNAVSVWLRDLIVDIDEPNTLEDLLGNIERQADSYARKAQELGNVEGRQGK